MKKFDDLAENTAYIFSGSG